MLDEIDLQLIAAPLSDLAGVTATSRRIAQKKGQTMADGSFPIRNEADLRNAIAAFGRAKNKAAAKAWIIRRARALGKTDMLPVGWKTSPGKQFDLIALDLENLPSTEPECEMVAGQDGEFVKAPGPCSLDRSAKHNWVEDVGGLPNYVCQVARAVARGGRSLDQAIPIAIGTLRNWAHGKGNVSAAVRARAAAALAEWEAKKARARANGAVVAEFDLYEEDEHLIEMLAAKDKGTPKPAKLPTDDKPYVRTDATIKKHGQVGVGRRGPYRKSGRHIYRNKRKVVLRLDGKPDGRSLRTNYKRYPTKAPAGLGGQFAPIGRGVKATKKKYGTAASLEETMEFAALGDQVVVKDGPHKGKHGKVIGRSPKGADFHLVRVGTRIVNVPKDQLEKKKEAGQPVAVTASGANVWQPEEFTYYYDDANDRTYRVADEDGTVQVFDGESLDWSAVDGEVDLSDFAKVKTQDTLEALVGGGADIDVVEDKDEEEDVDSLAAATKDEPVDKPEGAGEGGGPKFRIPLLIPEETWSGDRRIFAKGSLEVKEPPFPLLWQRETDDGHKRSVIVGRVDRAERLETGGIGNLEGVFDTHADAQEAARQVRERFVTTVSGDVDKFDHELAQDEDGKESVNIKHGRVVAATIVAKPAFQEAVIEYVPEDGEEALVASGAPGAGPLQPPQAWFSAPEMTEPYMLTVEDDGRVHGLIAEWGTAHTGNPAWKPPHNHSGYRYFNRKPVRTSEGTDVRCGQLTLTGGHPELGLDPDSVIRHYDDTRSAVADVVIGENEFGIWASGAMRPDISPEQVRAFRASEPSGDWRLRDSSLELLAVCMVNTAGFPVMPRALCASGGEVLALVAAGAPSHRTKVDLHEQIATLARLSDDLVERIELLEADLDARRRLELAASIEALR